MTKKINRRSFVLTGAAGLALTTVSRSETPTASPTIWTQKTVKPIVIASGNGNAYKNGGDVTCVQKAFDLMTKGTDVLDALIAGVNILELDPEEYSVGYGGVPNADGVVQLDSSCMHGPKKRAGAVAALEGVRTPSLVAQAVMDNTDHHLLVGKGAQMFARNAGFRVEDDLNTDRSRKMWLEWKRKIDPSHYLDPKTRSELWRKEVFEMIKDGKLDPTHLYGTINCNGINAQGDLCGVTTTSGLFFKIPGRVGDSPILGAGLYVDNGVGAAGSTGRGEANLYNLCSFLIIEEMRRGAHPKDAGLEALRRIKANTIEKRLLTTGGKPNFSVDFYIINAKGEHAGVSMYAESSYGSQVFKSQYAICTEQGPQTLRCESLLSERLVANG